MSHPELHGEPERKISREEIERSEEDVRERHLVREEEFGTGTEGRLPVAAGREVQPAGYGRISGAQREEIYDTREDTWHYATRVIGTLALWVWVVLAVVETLVALRLAFVLAAANPAAGFVSFVYGSTSWMVGPFQGIAPNANTGGGGFFEPASVVALLVYPLLALLVIAVLRTAAASPRKAHTFERRATRRRTY